MLYNDQKFKKKEVFIMGIKGFKIFKKETKREKEIDWEKCKVLNTKTNEETIVDLSNFEDFDKVMSNPDLCLVLD